MISIDAVKVYLDSHGIAVLEFDVATPTVETAAIAVGCTPAEIAKSILFLVGGNPIMVVTAGDTRVNSSMLKRASGLTGKVKFPSADEVMRETGYAPGGVCPFLLPESLPLILDRSLQRFARVYPAAGNPYSAVPVDFATLQMLTGGISGDVSVRNAQD